MRREEGGKSRRKEREEEEGREGGKNKGKEERPWHLLCQTSDLSYAQHPNFSSQYGAM